MFPTRTVILCLLVADIANCQCPDVSPIIAHDGTPVGGEEVIDGGKIPKIPNQRDKEENLNTQLTSEHVHLEAEQ